MSCDKHQDDQESVDDPSRRMFLTKVSLTLSGLIGVAIAPPLLAALAQPLLDKPVAQWRDVGPLENFPVDQTCLLYTSPSPRDS